MGFMWKPWCMWYDSTDADLLKPDFSRLQDFSLVICKKCDYEISYGEYIKQIAHSESTYSDILGDYTSNTEGQTAGSLDEWDWCWS